MYNVVILYKEFKLYLKEILMRQVFIIDCKKKKIRVNKFTTRNTLLQNSLVGVMQHICVTSRKRNARIKKKKKRKRSVSIGYK